MRTDLPARITEYLATGGLFNPELANHDMVRDLMIECRDALEAARQNLAEFRAQAPLGWKHDDFDHVVFKPECPKWPESGWSTVYLVSGFQPCAARTAQPPAPPTKPE
jgi:hypothetical protein